MRRSSSSSQIAGSGIAATSTSCIWCHGRLPSMITYGAPFAISKRVPFPTGRAYDTELAAYQLLHRLQCQYIRRHFGIVHFCITSESAPLHPITDVVQGLVLEYIHGVSMDTLQPGVDVSEQEAERISNDVMGWLHAIKAENFLLHNDIHTWNVVLPSSSPLERPTSDSLVLATKTGEGSSMAARIRSTCGGSWWIPRADVGRGQLHHTRCRIGTIKCLWRSMKVWRVCLRTFVRRRSSE
ncbi:hypothetical protein IW262DRAFT_176154 [Armillaria fumosa]|nr:hypothetical protein IW262DRAFT_176154 [Armillaria fumosa]